MVIRALQIVYVSMFLFLQNSIAQSAKQEATILPASHSIPEYFNLIKGKRVALFANQTSTIGKKHLVDTLKSLHINIVKVFAPEHGFRGESDAGESVHSFIDSISKVSVVSLYGNKTKPTAKDLVDVDVAVFDIQDIGVRCYTYISSLQELMESCIENDKPLIVLDRPNPNGFYIDGPVLDSDYVSFVGKQPIPLVYGMTIGEYAKMILGEKWLKPRAVRESDYHLSIGELLNFEKERKFFKLIIIPCKNYIHKSHYQLPIPPSPNLKDMASIYWYPSHCLVEGTVLSEGRGTDHPFCIIGHPNLPDSLYPFTPIAKPGAKKPKCKDIVCHGWNLYSPNNSNILKDINHQLQLKYILQAYQLFPDKDHFFIQPLLGRKTDCFFNKLAGNDQLMEQIKNTTSEETIRNSWKASINKFKLIRQKYLLYPDFN